MGNVDDDPAALFRFPDVVATVDLSGDVGAKFHQMDAEAGRFEHALAQVGEQMTATAAQGPGALLGWQAEQQQIVGARAQASGAQQTFTQQSATATQLGANADSAVANRQQQATRAQTHESQVQAVRAQREARANNLSGQLSAWAGEHKQDRMKAIEETRQKYERLGYTVTVRGG